MIGLYAPYACREETTIALSLCELAQNEGLDSSYLSYQAHEYGIDCLWDRRVIDGQKTSFGSWMQNCDHIVWFDCQRDKLLRARNAGKKNTLVFIGANMTKETDELLDVFDHVVFFNPKLEQQISPLPNTTTVLMPWAPAEYSPYRVARLDPEKLFALAWVNRHTACSLRGEIFSALQLAFESCPKLSVRLVGSKSWSRPAKVLLQDLIHRWPGRLQLVSRPSQQRWAELHAVSDVFMSWSSRESVGVPALMAAHAGLPVFAFDAPPINFFINNTNGRLISCELEDFRYGTCAVAARSRTILQSLEGCETALDELYYGQPSFSAQERRNVFAERWKSIWSQ